MDVLLNSNKATNFENRETIVDQTSSGIEDCFLYHVTSRKGTKFLSSVRYLDHVRASSLK